METQVRQLYEPLFLYVKKRVDNREDAEDLTQDVFYKLSKSNNSNVNSFRSWAYTVAKNTITDYYRKKKIITTGKGVENIAYLEEKDNSADISEMSQCIGRFIDQLPEDYRSIMILSELEEMSQKEIAAQLNMNYVTVRSKIQRGRKKLRTLFSNCCLVTQGGKGSIMDIKSKASIKKDPDCCEEDILN